MKTPREFLTALWGNPPPGAILIWTLPKKESNWYTRLDQVNRDMEHHAHEDIYTGMGIARINQNTLTNEDRLTSKDRLTEENVAGLAGLWAEIDCNHPFHGRPNLPPSLEHAMETLEGAQFEPTLLVNSGHGLQAWWLFELPWIFHNPEDQELGRRAAQWWHQQINGLYTARGWTTDSVFNLDRIMRLPGTWNNRDTWERKPVTAITCHTTSWTSFPKTSEPPPRRRDTTGGALPPEAGEHLGLRATMAIQAGWSDQEVVNLLICWRRKHDHDLKFRENYFVMTLDKAKEEEPNPARKKP